MLIKTRRGQAKEKSIEVWGTVSCGDTENRLRRCKYRQKFPGPSEFQKVGDNGSVVDQVWDVAHGGLRSHLWVVMVVVSLALGYLPVNGMSVGWDHLVYGGVSSPCGVASVRSLMGPRWSPALGFEVPEGLVGANRGRAARLPGDGPREGTGVEAGERGSQVLPLLLLLFLPEPWLRGLGGAQRRLLVQSRGRGCWWNRVAVDLDPVGVHLWDVLASEALLLPEYVCQGGWGEESRGHGPGGGLSNTSTSQDRSSGLGESPSLDASGSSVLEPNLWKKKAKRQLLVGWKRKILVASDVHICGR